MEKPPLDLVRGTLDLLILKTLTWGPMHGYAIVATIRQSTDAAVLVIPGVAFGSAGEGFIRISFAASLQTIGTGIERIGRWLRSPGH